MDTLLFDLDGTLLHMDTDQFLEEYIRALTPHFAHLVEPARFAKQLMASTYAMVQNQDPRRTNQEVFMADFFAKIGLPAEQLMPLFDNFYINHFKELKRFTSPNPWAKDVMVKAFANGWQVAVATNPVFPKEAIKERLRWAGIDSFPYRLVTSYEFMHSCKPQPGYYREILDLMRVAPEQCLMVGNDVDEDLVAGSLGIKTFLAEECVINRAKVVPKADYIGSFALLLELVGHEPTHSLLP